MKNNLFPLWLSPVLMGAGTMLVYASNVTISYTPPNASLNTLLTGELVVPAQMPIPGAEPLKLLGLGSIGAGLARLGGYAFGKKSESSDLAQLPPWQGARGVTPMSYTTQPMRDASAPEAEVPLDLTTNLDRTGETAPTAVVAPAPTENLAVAPTAAVPPAPTENRAVAPTATAPISAAPDPVALPPSEPPSPQQVSPSTPKAESPAPALPTQPVTVNPQPPGAEKVEIQPQPVASTVSETISPPAESPEAPSTEISDNTTTGQTTNPLGVVSRIVEALTSSSMPQHVAIAGIPRGGKSYSLRGIIWGIKQVEPEATIRIVDPKNSPVGWLGLEKIPGCVRFAHHGLQSAIETIDEAIALLDRATDTRDTRQKAYFIFDDWSGLLAEARRLDAKAADTEPHASKIYPDLIYNMERLALKGLEYGIHLIVATHSWDCVEFGFDAQCRFAFAIAALGRQGRWETLSSLLKSDVLIPDDEVSERLVRQKNEAIEKVRDRESPIVLLTGDNGVLDALPDFEWLDWVDLSVFADKLVADTDAIHRNGNASMPMAEMA
ncbi:MAG: hypothetical protein WBG66_10320 [Geitlerinemataceae cyanobacterium]